jgi:hypothetical protein
MKKYILSTIIATTALMISQASIALTDMKITELPVKIVTKKEQIRVAVPHIPRYKIIRSNPYRISHKLLDDDSDDFIDDGDIITTYRRRDLNKQVLVEDLSDYVKFRLFLARQMAMLKYYKLHS